MTEGNRYLRIKAVLCPDCRWRSTCPQFTEQMDACADALLIQVEDGDEALPVSFAEFMRLHEDEEDDCANLF